MSVKNIIYNVCFSFSFFVFSFGIVGCKKNVEVPFPYNRTSSDLVFSDDATAKAALTGIYTQMSNATDFTGSKSIGINAGLSADELNLYSGVSDQPLIAYYKNSLVSNGSLDFGTDAWRGLYRYVYWCNAAIEGLYASTTLTPFVKQQLLGEAKFLRAFFYFYLVNLYGDLPLAVATDYKVNALLPRASKDEVYKQIISDLNDAHDLLSPDYLAGNLIKYSGLPERVRPTKWAAAALLAKAYLYKGNDYDNAENKSTELISNLSIYSLDTLNGVFLKNSKEAIWQLQPVNNGRNTEEARTFILTTSGPTTNTARPVFLSDTLLNSFQAGDQRKSKWVNSVVTTGSGIKYYYPFKYKNNSAAVTEYLMVLRLGEQYLIRAEARIQKGNPSGALSDLNTIRQRAGLTDYSGPTDKNSLLAAILHERQVELFTEWGSRWLDLKRTETLDALMTVVTPKKTAGLVQWSSYKKLYPISFSDIQKDPNLVQNSGY